MPTIVAHRPRPNSPAVALDKIPEELDLAPVQLDAWLGQGDLPTHQVPPHTARRRGGKFWALRDDALALCQGQDLTPPPEIHDDQRRVYVIELEGCTRRAHKNHTCVYVGESWHPARARFLQHLLGYKASTDVRKWGARLRPDLYENVPISRRPSVSQKHEKETAERLVRDGYNVHGAKPG
jgi:hypothetical protein